MANATQTQNTFDPTVALNKIMDGNTDELDKAMGVPPGGSVLTVSLTAKGEGPGLLPHSDYLNTKAGTVLAL